MARRDEVTPPPDPLAALAEALERMRRLVSSSYDGGVNGTCYECPYASPPLEKDGSVADWRDISNDPTEAYFRCSLPGRDNAAVVWGEYAPCTEAEWFEAHRSAALAAAGWAVVRKGNFEVKVAGHSVTDAIWPHKAAQAGEGLPVSGTRVLDDDGNEVRFTREPQARWPAQAGEGLREAVQALFDEEDAADYSAIRWNVAFDALRAALARLPAAPAALEDHEHDWQTFTGPHIQGSATICSICGLIATPAEEEAG